VFVFPNEWRATTQPHSDSSRTDATPIGRLDWRTAAPTLPYRHTLPVRNCNGCSFQFGRTSRCGPHALHFAHTIFWANDVTSTSSANFDTSIRPSCWQDGFKQ